MADVRCFQTTQKIKGNLDQVWSFFSTPLNLNNITPPDMHFDILPNQHLDHMYPGQIIRYNIEPFKGIKFRWVTEITHVKDKAFFVDEQRFGPYAFWHHQHIFNQISPDCVTMQDIVHYALPFGKLGQIFAGGMVRKKIESIFKYRKELIGNYFKG